MTDNRWQKTKEIFAEAIELAENEREAFVRDACGDDTDLFAEVMDLIKADATPASVLGQSGPEQFERMISSQMIGTTVGPYRIIEQIASGGMGAVYLAERADGHFEQKVALKLIKRGMDSEEILRRFHAERRILAPLQHPNIARLLDGGIAESGQSYFSMEYVDGLPITNYCDRQSLTIDQRLRLFIETCRAVHYAHQNLIIHRDLKPSNVMVDNDGTVKLIDFGIAKMLDSDSGEPSADLTRTGMFVMTPEYAAPEQISGAAISTATDIYSLGVILVELLTGSRPQWDSFRNGKLISKQITESEPNRPSIQLKSENKEQHDNDWQRRFAVRHTEPDKLIRTLAGDLDNICLKALQSEPQRRYSSAAQFAEDIERFMNNQPVIARADSAAYRIRKFVRRNRSLLVGLAAIILVIAGLVTFYTIRLADERDRATLEAEKSNQMVELLTGMFSAADPNISKGKDITAKELLDIGSASIDSQLVDQPELRVSMLNVLAASYLQLGQFGKADSALHKALEVCKIDLKNRPTPELSKTVHLMGTYYYDLGMYDSSAVYSEMAVSLDSVLYGPNSNETASSLNDLATTYRRLGDMETAEPLLRQALALRRELHGEVHEDVAHTLNHLGRLLYQQGKYDEALPYLTEALDIRLELFGDEHFETVASRGAVGALYRATGEHDKAVASYRIAMNSIISMVGEDHFYVGALSNSLGNALMSDGNYEEAEQLFLRSIENSKENFPGDKLKLANPMLSFGKVLNLTGRAAEAEPVLREAFDSYSAKMGPEYRRTADAETALGECLFQLGRTDEARTYLEHAYRVLSGQLEPEHEFVIQARNSLNELYQSIGYPLLQ